MIGKRIKQLRKTLDITQAEFSKPLNILSTAVSKYETGQINPSYDILTKIGNIYNVNLNWLLAGKGDIFLPKHSFSKKDIELLDTIRNLDSSFQDDIFKYIAERKKLSAYAKGISSPPQNLLK